MTQARAWGKGREREIMSGVPMTRGTVATLFTRYAKEVSPTKRGGQWEVIRLRAMERTTLAQVPLLELQPRHVAEWRDERLRSVTGATVAREYNLLSSVFDIARREWGLLSVNPAKDVRRPPQPPARSRLPTEDEIERICLALGYEGGEPRNGSQRVAVAFLLGIETGMRAGELTGLTWDRVGPKKAVLPLTKNGEAREVPLSPRARELFALLPKDGPSVLGLSTKVLDTLFRRAREKAKIHDLHFHDSRAEFCTRASKKLSVVELARAIGHRDLRSLLRYYRESAESIADRL